MLKYAIITSNSYFSYIILSQLLAQCQDRIGVVIEARGMIRGKGTTATLRAVLRKSGWRGFSYKVGTALYSRCLDQTMKVVPGCKRVFSPLTHAKKLGIPVRRFTDANSEDCLEVLRSVHPDLIFGVNVYQRLKPPLLRLPCLGVVNCHFGMLPNYRGMSPYMWALARNERELGITAHFMDEQFDTGDIIAQARVPIRERDSAYGLYIRGCLVARQMLAGIAGAAEKGDIPREKQPHEGSYFSLPGRECVRDIRRNGHKLLRFRDLAGIAFGRLEGEDLPSVDE